MWHVNRMFLSVLVGAVLVAFALAHPVGLEAQMHGNLNYVDRADGGVEVKFATGCSVGFDRHAKRDGSTGSCTNHQFEMADDAAMSYLGVSGNSSGNTVPEYQMEKYCQGEASATLNTRPTNISTRPVQRRGSDFIVYGQSPQSGRKVTTFECAFGKRGVFKGVTVLSWADETGAGTSGNTVPEGQMESYCQGEASATLGLRPTYISTRPVERRGSDFVVYGQSSQNGKNNTSFECLFGKRGVFKGVSVTGTVGGSDGSTSGNTVPEGQMQNYCQGEASAMLNTRPTNISTNPTQRRGTDFIVFGQSPRSGSNVTTFECVFGKRGVFKGVTVLHRAQEGSGGSGYTKLPNSAKQRCLDRFGAPADITQVSPLRPGYWELIVQNKSGSRGVACTVDDEGYIEDWVEMR